MKTLSPRRKSALVLLIIASLITAFVVVFWFGRENANTVTKTVEQVSVEGVGTPEGKPTSGLGTLESLAKDGKDLECQIVYERAGTEGNIEGTYFTSKGNFRGDFMVPAPEFGGKIVSSMIVGGDSLYVWSTIEKDTFGFKSSLSSAKSKEIDTKEPVPLEAEVKYTCTEWTTVDGSVFVPPADVSFQDLNAVINAGMEFPR